MRFNGVAPERLLEQVRSTAGWCLEGPTEGPANSWRASLRGAKDVPRAYGQQGHAYLRLLLSAHFATVATFVPTDVDSHIRHHAWRSALDAATLREMVEVVDEAAAWEAREVSARAFRVPEGGWLSGHEGEWLAVRAGALGRAFALDDGASVEALLGRIDAEVARELSAWESLRDAAGSEQLALCVAVTVAHNLGDLARVVDQWNLREGAAGAVRHRLSRLGRDPADGGDPRVASLRRVNAAVMAPENDRFLPLRAARPLRVSRALLLPLAPWLDSWGELLAGHPGLDDEAEGGALGGRAAVLSALVEGHAAQPERQGYLRAIAGMHHALPGGVEALADGVPARLRKALYGGALRAAFGVDRGRFAQRVVNRYRAALTG